MFIDPTKAYLPIWWAWIKAKVSRYTATTFTVAAFGYVIALAACGGGHPAFAFTTVEDMQSGRYAEAPRSYTNQNTAVQSNTDVYVDTGEANIAVPLNSVTTCAMFAGYGSCSNREVKPDPTDCPAGQYLITMRKYGYISHVCAKAD